MQTQNLCVLLFLEMQQTRDSMNNSLSVIANGFCQEPHCWLLLALIYSWLPVTHTHTLSLTSFTQFVYSLEQCLTIKYGSCKMKSLHPNPINLPIHLYCPIHAVKMLRGGAEPTSLPKSLLKVNYGQLKTTTLPLHDSSLYVSIIESTVDCKKGRRRVGQKGVTIISCDSSILTRID